MATAAPDPKTFQKWEDAFQYPIPTVRALEKKLRAGATETQERLRGVVGSSYRELLTTAHTIVDIHGQARQVEDHLAHAATKSNSKTLDKIATNAEQFHLYRRNQDAAQFAYAAQLAVLRGALSSVSDKLRTSSAADEQTLLTSAKLLILARLICRTLAASSGTTTLDKLQARLTSLRSKLLRHVDRRLSRTEQDAHAQVADLTAFALVTSCTPTDALKHFFSVRTAALERKHAQSDPQKRLSVYLSTLRDSKAIFPALLSASLRSVSAASLLSDEAVRGVEVLGLDVHERWIAPSVTNFTPYTRHDELSAYTTESLRSSWALDTLPALSQAIASDLSAILDLGSIVSVRRRVLQHFLSSRHLLRGVPSASVLTALRRPFIDAISALLDARLADLKTSIEEPLSTLLASPLPPPTDLWDEELSRADPSDSDFTSRLIAARKGHSAPIASLLARFDEAADVIASAPAVLKAMADSRWDDDDDDDDDAADDATSDAPSPNIHTALSQTDPASLHTSLAASTSLTMSAIESLFTTLAPSLPPPAIPPVLRILRALRTHPTLRPAPSFCATPVAALHARLVAATASTTLPTLASRLPATYADPAAPLITHVWDAGAPTLPTPPVVRFLQRVVAEMAERGADVWGGHAAALLRRRLRRGVGSVMEGAREAIEGKGEEGRVLRVQLLFDGVFLGHALGGAGAADGEVEEEEAEQGATLDAVVAGLREALALEGEAAARLERHAAGYWARTALLWGLLGA